MAFLVNDHIFGEATLQNVTATRAASYAQLRVDLILAVNPLPNVRPVVLRELSGRVLVQGHGMPEAELGRLHPMTLGYVIEARANGQQCPLNLVVDVGQVLLADLATLPGPVRLIIELYGIAQYSVSLPAPAPTPSPLVALASRISGRLATLLQGPPPPTIYREYFLSLAHGRLTRDYDGAGWTSLVTSLRLPMGEDASWDATLTSYYRLAVLTLQAAVPEAALFFIGAAAEWLLEELGRGTLAPIISATKWQNAQKSKKTEDKVKVILETLELSTSPRKVDMAEREWLRAQATLYRLDRNDVGHPQATPPSTPKHEVEARVRCFPDYVRRMQDAAARAIP